jgi:predicted small integral membrane protein
MAIEHDPVTKAPEPAEHGREGFLPITTNAFDRGFIGVVLFVAIHLLWMRFLEPFGLSLWFATVLSLLLAQWIIRKG